MNNIAFIVTCGVYREKSFNLAGTAVDAEHIADALTKKCGCQHCYTLRDCSGMDILHGLKGVSKSTGDTNYFFFYFAGHGVSVNNGQEAQLILSDAYLRERTVKGRLSEKDIAPEIWALFQPKKTILIFDMCLSATESRGMNAAGSDSESMLSVDSFFYDSHGNNLQPSFEECRGRFHGPNNTFRVFSTLPGEIAWGNEKGGYFTQCFTQALLECDPGMKLNTLLEITNKKLKTGHYTHHQQSFHLGMDDLEIIVSDSVDAPAIRSMTTSTLVEPASVQPPPRTEVQEKTLYPFTVPDEWIESFGDKEENAFREYVHHVSRELDSAKNDVDIALEWCQEWYKSFFNGVISHDHKQWLFQGQKNGIKYLKITEDRAKSFRALKKNLLSARDAMKDQISIGEREFTDMDPDIQGEFLPRLEHMKKRIQIASKIVDSAAEAEKSLSKFAQNLKRIVTAISRSINDNGRDNFDKSTLSRLYTEIEPASKAVQKYSLLLSKVKKTLGADIKKYFDLDSN